MGDNEDDSWGCGCLALAAGIVILYLLMYIIGFLVVVICLAGGGVGSYYSIRNYILAFKDNVIDNNRSRK